ncbi:MAG: autotransporter assembly complex protein TamA [Paracoccaceae bacterium]
MNIVFPLRRTALATVCASLIAAVPAMPVRALDDLSFRLNNAADTKDNDTLLDSIRGGSLLRLSQTDGRTEPQDLFAAAQADYQRIVETLYAQGYYGPVVHILIDGREAATIPPLNPPANISKIAVSVTPGPQFRFGTARINPLPPGAALAPDFRTGKVARSTIVQSAAVQSVSDWRANGHAKADVAAQDISADHAKRQLNADITLAPGPLVKFGRMQVNAEGTVVSANRLRTIASLPEGEVFDPEALEKSANRLRRTGTFRSVVLTESETLGPDNSMDITTTVIDEKPRRIGAGVELSSFDGVTLEGFWLHRNITGRADRLRIDGKVSGIGGNTGGIDYTLSARFERPAVYGPDTKGFAFVEAEREDEPTYRQDTGSIGIGASRFFSDTLTGELAVALRYSQITDAFGRRDFTLLTFPGYIENDRRDDKLNPSSGSYIKADLTPYLDIRGAAPGARFLLDARAYRDFGSDGRFVLAGRAQIGSVLGSSIADTAPDYLFYSGGGGTVRGQPYQSLDVDLGGGLSSGGRSFVGFSGELRAKIGASKFSLVGFADVGYIGSESLYDGSGQWHSGAGLGVRYDTVVGPIRLDVASPVSGNTGDGVQIYIGIGQSF